MRFLKENISDIVKLIVNQLGVTIFSFFLYTAVGMIEDASVKLGVNIAVSVVSIIFFCFLLYTVAWDWGAKDKIRIDAGRLEEHKYKGIFISLYANVINFVIAFLSALTAGIFLLSDARWLINLHFAINAIMRFTSSMYIGVIGGIFAGLDTEELVYLSSFCESIGFFFFPIIAILATHIGYTMGLKEKKIFASSKKDKK